LIAEDNVSKHSFNIQRKNNIITEKKNYNSVSEFIPRTIAKTDPRRPKVKENGADIMIA